MQPDLLKRAGAVFLYCTPFLSLFTFWVGGGAFSEVYTCCFPFGPGRRSILQSFHLSLPFSPFPSFFPPPCYALANLSFRYGVLSSPHFSCHASNLRKSRPNPLIVCLDTVHF